MLLFFLGDIMANFTVREAIRRAKMKADMKHSNFVSQEDWVDFFNEAYGEMYDLLISTSENYRASEHIITLTAQTTDYALPADFYKGIAWDFAVNPGSNIYTTIKKYNNSERNNTVGNVANIPNGQVRLTYYPEPQKMTEADLDVSLAGLAGYEKLIVTQMAILALDSEESDTRSLNRQYEKYYVRIEEAAQERDLGQPSTVSDAYVEGNSLYHPTLRFRLYGDEVRFLTTTYVGV